MQPIVYDKFDTKYEGYGLAILENAKDVRVYEKLNEEHTLEFVLPRNDPKWEYIQIENFVKVDGHLYIIRTTEERRDGAGKLLSNVQCEHIFTELLDEYIQYEELINVTAQFALDRFLNGTRFSADATRLTGNRDLEVEDGTPITAINLMLKEWNAEVMCAGLPGQDGKFRVTLLPERGENRGIQIRYRKNLKSIKKTVDSRGVVTRLYVYGKDGLGIEGASQNTAKLSYLDSQYIGNYPRPKKGSITFNDIEDPDELYKAGQEHLKTVEVPKVTYEVDLIDLQAVAEYGDTEAIELGDTVRVIDEELGIDVFARVVEYEKYPYEPWRSKVVLANFRPGLSDFLSELNDAKDTIQKVTTSKGNVNASFLEGIINTLKTRITGSMAMANAQVMEDKGILFENTDVNSPDYGALYIGPGIFAIADRKNGNEWDWRTFGTGSGFTADVINAGILNAALVKILASNAVYLDGTGMHVIDSNNNERVRIGEYKPGKFGIKVTDGEMYSTRFQTNVEGADTYVALEPPATLVCYKNGKKIIQIDASHSEPRIEIYNKYGQRLGTLGTYGVNDIEYIGIFAPRESGGITLSTGDNLVIVPSKGSMKIETSGELYVKGDIYATGSIRAGGGIFG
ncbi:phage minor structural protein, N-terminal region [Aneurinibacillus thermoaerophilus]|uniref:Phage minor structural protein, N-terminal region n=1 Tax=Aneurinibacillus thermoaerophilus TaxID=143495 RepID=A0A1G8F5V0_ANETH|nr:phage tail protein [Aneurinibacillus thermoaerophilus]SDH77494.1 phage minor structural protein, N-terminal region [Aneurinibacillus thermoaerophilus]